MNLTISLLDAMAIQARCEYLSDLRYIDDVQRARLARALEKISPEAGTLFEWNDALAYMTGETAQPTQRAAKERLIFLLAAPRNMGQTEKDRQGGICT